jgi:hypothetical protein
VPDLPQIPDTPQIPDAPHVPETPQNPDAPDNPELATMPTPGPVHPVTPMPTVAPAHRPVPMLTVTPPQPVPPAPDEPAERDQPVESGVSAEFDMPGSAATAIDSQPTGDSEPGTVVAESPDSADIADAPAAPAEPLDLDAQPTGDSEPAVTAPETQAENAATAAEDAPPAPETPEPTAEQAPEPTAIASEPAAASEPAPDAGSPQPNRQASGPRVSGGRPRGGRPGGKPGARPGGRPSPVPSAPQPTGLVEPIVESIDPHLWGRIDDEGVVYVTTAAGERAIGNWQAGDTEAGLQHFGRKFDDFSTEIALLEARLASGTGDPKATKAQAIALREQVETLAAIGDLDTAAIRLEIVIGAADAAIAGASHARTAARAAAVKAKEALCIEAEELAESTQWKSTGDRLKAIVEEWRTIRGIDRKTDDALWKRFAKARDTFTRHRGSHFAELDKQRGAAKEAKEALIAKAEALSDATDWGETAGAYRTLMEEWKAAGRAPRDVEDALWARFRAAQEKFFSRRNKTFSDRDAEFLANAAIKEKLLAEAEKIDPATGLDAAKTKMRSIQERWEAAGKVPRERIREFDSRLKAVEDKLKSAEDRHWRRTDPETSARVEQFRARVDSYRAQASKARASGDERKAREADAQAKQWEEWLKTAQGAVDG